jgi:hypothetical protein
VYIITFFLVGKRVYKWKRIPKDKGVMPTSPGTTLQRKRQKYRGERRMVVVVMVVVMVEGLILGFFVSFAPPLIKKQDKNQK